MKKFVKTYLLSIVGVIVGAVAGYAYWQFVGCSSGSCAITSKPLNSTLYGAVMGGLLFSIFQNNNKKNV